MALRYLKLSDETNALNGECIYEEIETLSTPGTGDVFLLPDGSGKIDGLLVNLIISSGSGKVQYSLSTREKIIADNAVWKDWDSGVITATTDDVFYPVSAIRQVNISGITTIEVRAI